MSDGQPFDGFGDVIEKESGIFTGSTGLKAYDSVRHSATPEGLLVEVHCESCGFPRHLTIPWPELVALKYNVSPHEAFQNVPQLQQFASPWRLPTEQALRKGVKYAWMPAGLQCRCGAPFSRPHITPNECEALLGGGRTHGFLTMQQEKPIADHCFQVARSLGRRR